MLKKMLKSASALLLSLTLLAPMHILCTTAQETDPMDKTGENVPETEEYEHEYFDVTVDIIQPDYSDLYRQVNDAFPEYPAWDGIGTDSVPERQKLFRQLKYERQREYVDEILSEAGLTEDRLLCVSPLMVVLTDEEINVMNANDKVTAVYDSYYIDVEYSYTAETSLRILRIAAGAEPANEGSVDTEHYWRIVNGMGSMTPIYDINQDGNITALDASMALQCAVGRRGISPGDIPVQRISRLMEKDAVG